MDVVAVVLLTGDAAAKFGRVLDLTDGAAALVEFVPTAVFFVVIYPVLHQVLFFAVTLITLDQDVVVKSLVVWDFLNGD